MKSIDVPTVNQLNAKFHQELGIITSTVKPTKGNIELVALVDIEGDHGDYTVHYRLALADSIAHYEVYKGDELVKRGVFNKPIYDQFLKHKLSCQKLFYTHGQEVLSTLSGGEYVKKIVDLEKLAMIRQGYNPRRILFDTGINTSLMQSYDNLASWALYDQYGVSNNE